jgi:hypothetical protein
LEDLELSKYGNGPDGGLNAGKRIKQKVLVSERLRQRDNRQSSNKSKE